MGVELSGGKPRATPDVAGAVPADPDEVLFLVEGQDGPDGDLAGSGFTSARHRLADRVALWLAEPPPGRAGESFVAELDVPVRMVPGLAEVFVDVPAVVEAWPAGAVRVARGRGGVVVRVHGVAGSVVFRVGGRVLVVLDAMPERALRVDRDRDWVPEVTGMVDAVLRELDRRAPGGDRHAAG